MNPDTSNEISLMANLRKHFLYKCFFQPFQSSNKNEILYVNLLTRSKSMLFSISEFLDCYPDCLHIKVARLIFDKDDEPLTNCNFIEGIFMQISTDNQNIYIVFYNKLALKKFILLITERCLSDFR